MLNRSIDKAFDALAACRQDVPFLRDIYRPGSREWIALNEVLRAVGEARFTLATQPARGGPVRGSDGG